MNFSEKIYQAISEAFDFSDVDDDNPTEFQDQVINNMILDKIDTSSIIYGRDVFSPKFSVDAKEQTLYVSGNLVRPNITPNITQYYFINCKGLKEHGIKRLVIDIPDDSISIAGNIVEDNIEENFELITNTRLIILKALSSSTHLVIKNTKISAKCFIFSHYNSVVQFDHAHIICNDPNEEKRYICFQKINGVHIAPSCLFENVANIIFCEPASILSEKFETALGLYRFYGVAALDKIFKLKDDAKDYNYNREEINLYRLFNLPKISFPQLKRILLTYGSSLKRTTKINGLCFYSGDSYYPAFLYTSGPKFTFTYDAGWKCHEIKCSHERIERQTDWN